MSEIQAVVIGAGGFGRETLDVVDAHNRAFDNTIVILGVVDDVPSEINLERLKDREIPWLGTIDQLVADRPCEHYLLGIGSPQVKVLIARRLDDAGFTPVTVVHPGASVGTQVQLGAGTIICGGAQVSTNVKIGRHVHLKPNCTIGHDADLDDYVSVNPGAVISGEVTIGSRALVGAGAVVLQGLDIAGTSITGASACVTKDVSFGSTVLGVPAVARTTVQPKMGNSNAPLGQPVDSSRRVISE